MPAGQIRGNSMFVSKREAQSQRKGRGFWDFSLRNNNVINIMHGSGFLVELGRVVLLI